MHKFNTSSFEVRDGSYFIDGLDVTKITEVVSPGFVAVIGQIGRKRFHVYFHIHADGVSWGPMRGVTTVLKVNSKENITQWAADRAALKAYETKYPTLTEEWEKAKAIEDWKARGNAIDLIDDKYPDFYEARTAHVKKRDDAGDQGTDIHADIETYIKRCIAENNGDPMTPEAGDPTHVDNFAIWAGSEGIVFLASEKVLCSIPWWTAGKTDLIFKKGDRVYVGDIKTHAKLWDRIPFLQCGAYGRMAKEMGLYDPVGSCIITIPKKTLAVSVAWSHDIERDQEGFQAALTLGDCIELTE